MVNVPSILLWGFAATLILTTVVVAGQALGLTRIDMPFIVGSMFTPNRDRARILGAGLHAFNGWWFAAIYALFFEHMKAPSIVFGAAMGLAQGVIVLVLLLPLLPGVHPRMVSDSRGPEPTRLLEPPGFLARNYGRGTALVLLVAHTIYGSILGAFYTLQ